MGVEIYGVVWVGIIGTHTTELFPVAVPNLQSPGRDIYLHLLYSGALADRIWNFGNSQIEYFFGLPEWVNLGKAQNSQLEYFHPRRGPCS